MVKVREDAWQCPACRAAGEPLEDDCDSDVTSEDDPDDKHASVQRHGGVYVGMPYGSGYIHEIYPALDKLTVQCGTGVINHLRLSRTICKLAEAKERATETALNEMD